MSWGSSPAVPAAEFVRAWFPAPPDPVASHSAGYWRGYLDNIVLAAALSAPDAQLLGVHSQSGTLAAQLRRLVFAGSAEHRYQGSLEAELHALNALLTNVQIAELTGMLTGPDAAFVGQHIIGGTLGASLPPPRAAMAAQQIYTGTLGAALRTVVANMTGQQIVSGVLDADITRVLMAATGQQTISGALAAVLRKAVFAGTADQAFIGTLAAQVRAALAALSGTYTAPHAPEVTPYTTTGAFSYPIPDWCNFVDRIVLGGGGGGGGASFAFTPAQGGDAGAFAWDTLQRGVDFSYTETAITGTVGTGGSAGTGAGSGGNGGNSTATINGNTITGTGGTGRGGSGTQNGDAVTSGNANSGKDVSLNGQTYAGGATSTGTTANVPGAGGRGGSAFSNGNAGARGQVWFCARQN